MTKADSINKRLSRAATRTLAAVIAILSASGTGLAAEKTLLTFNGANGKGPVAALTLDAAGNLYGTTPSGGTNGNGTVFKLTPTSNGQWKQSVLYAFDTSHHPKGPWGPFSGVTFDSVGNLYGTTYYGGASTGGSYCPTGCGTVFKLTPTPTGPWKASILHSFTGRKDGGNPNAGVVFDAQGNLYGAALSGGTTSGDCPNGCGVVFKVTLSAKGLWTESVLHSFTGGRVNGDGAGPYATLIADKAGNLYGTTLGGGTSTGSLICPSGCGTTFQLSPLTIGNWNYSVIHSFVGGKEDGAGPVAGVIVDMAGNLYGATAGGGAQAAGAIFELTPGSSGWTSMLLYSFHGLADGSTPDAPVVLDTAGNLYGTVVQNGSYGMGAVFELTPSGSGTWTETVLLSFQGTHGSSPWAGLVLDAKGNLYGTTEFGGSASDGIVFEVTR